MLFSVYGALFMLDVYISSLRVAIVWENVTMTAFF